VVIAPEWLEFAQIFVRLILTLLCAAMLNLAFEKKPKENARYFIILVALGAVVLKIVSSRIFDARFLFMELALFMALILAVSILAGAQLLAGSGGSDSLKSAGAIWIAGAVGLTIGSGYYFAGIFTAIIGHLIILRMKTNDNIITNQNH
jgi:putative Mg2+ transporter-C (MgtC) family protein